MPQLSRSPRAGLAPQSIETQRFLPVNLRAAGVCLPQRTRAENAARKYFRSCPGRAVSGLVHGGPAWRARQAWEPLLAPAQAA